MKKGVPIVPFFGGPLSQWKQALFVDDNGKQYCNPEQYFMANKAITFNDKEALSAIMATNNSKKIKAIGRHVRNFDERVWNEKRVSVALQANRYKFKQLQGMGDYLLSFPHDCVFAECSPFDREWGIGLSIGDPDVFDYTKWRGRNLLGFLLTRVRDEIVKKE